jgi:hypothetical protein
MEAFILIGVYLLLMGSIVLILSGIISFFFPKIHFLFILAGSALAGVIFSYIFELGGLMLGAVVLNVFLSAIAIGLAKYGRYLKSKADFEADSILH